MNEERPFLQIPLQTEEDYRLYEEWLRREKEEENTKDEDRVIVIDL
tara:strand:- start:471 stop:608 length:138 start_codon:yes stop_codon:yes gene_type:complete